MKYFLGITLLFVLISMMSAVNLKNTFIDMNRPSGMSLIFPTSSYGFGGGVSARVLLGQKTLLEK